MMRVRDCLKNLTAIIVSLKRKWSEFAGGTAFRADRRADHVGAGGSGSRQSAHAAVASGGASQSVEGKVTEHKGQWVKGEHFQYTQIDGRYVIGEPRGTFYQQPFLAKQPGKYSRRGDVAADIAVVGDLLVMGASFRGAMHYAAGAVRQDSFAIGSDGEYGEGKWLIAAVADGVSSASQAHALAEFLTQQTILTVEERLASAGHADLSRIDWGAISGQLVALSREYCKARAQSMLRTERENEIDRITLQQYLTRWASTLEFAVVEADTGGRDGGNRRFVYVSVAGDGAAYIVNGLKGWHTVKAGKQQDSVILSGAVAALPADPGEPRIRLGTLQSGDHLFITTDGLGDRIGSGDSPAGVFFQHEFPACNNLISFLQIMDVSMYQADDDRTGILIKERRHAD